MQLFSFKRGFLKKQKVRKRNSKANKKKQRRAPFALLVFVVFILALLSFLHLPNKLQNIYSETIDDSWTITESFSNNRANDTKEKLDTKLFENKNLISFIQSLKKYDPYNKVTVIHTGPKKIHISIEQRQAVMTVALDKLRNISSKGHIFGVSVNKNLPSLTGVFKKGRKKYRFSDRNALVTTTEEKEKINKALLILKASTKLGLTPKEIKFTPYRGYSVQLTQGTWLVLGTKPFQHKIAKFLDLKRKLLKEHKKITYMELDYRGKAFIKTKSTGV